MQCATKFLLRTLSVFPDSYLDEKYAQEMLYSGMNRQGIKYSAIHKSDRNSDSILIHTIGLKQWAKAIFITLNDSSAGQWQVI